MPSRIWINEHLVYTHGNGIVAAPANKVDAERPAFAVKDLPVSAPEVRRTNHALRRLARLLVPVNYTRGPEFFHDPAESIPALPDLSVALQLPDSEPGEAGFVITHLTRGQNRLVAALRDARRTVQAAMA